MSLPDVEAIVQNRAMLPLARIFSGGNRVTPRHSNASYRGEGFSIMRVAGAVLALSLCSTGFAAFAQQPGDTSAKVANRTDRLSLNQILSNLEQRNAQRAAALERFESTRVYRMQYRGFPSDRNAEMTVKVSFQAPNSKQFTVLSETGSRFVIEHVFKKLLEAEEEAAKADNRSDSALTRRNYDFELAGFEKNPQGDQYVLALLPKNKNKYLYRGKIWVDAKDFAVVRIEGEPGKNPSMWIKKTDIAHSYKKVDDFWLPAENHTESFIRLGGKASLSIEYQDYKITKASGLHSAKIKAANRGGDSTLEGVAISDRNVLSNLDGEGASR
jgi:outer membrane lipoprotein-sorting protein